MNRRTKFAAVGMSLALMGGCTSESSPDSSESSAHTKAAVEQKVREGYVAPSIGEVVLSRGNMCAWSPTKPMVRPPADNKLRVDGRCAFPMPPDGNPVGDFVGVYPHPVQVGESVTKVESGSYVNVGCYILGQTIEDGKHYETPLWIRLTMEEKGETPLGYIPAFATGYALPANPC